MNRPTTNLRKRTIVFVKHPTPGTCKTRLIPALGADGAARLQHEMTHLLLSRLDRADKQDIGEVELRYSGAEMQDMARLYGAHRSFTPQGSGDLGSRLARALEQSLSECDRAVAVGSDCPELDAHHIKSAFEALGTADVVLGPALDGGYYLIAMSRFHADLFRDIPWSTSSVRERTIERARRSGLTVHQLVPLLDVDEPADLEHWRRVRDAAAQTDPTFTPIKPQ